MVWVEEFQFWRRASSRLTANNGAKSVVWKLGLSLTVWTGVRYQYQLRTG